jgi:hypothetical protein
VHTKLKYGATTGALVVATAFAGFGARATGAMTNTSSSTSTSTTASTTTVAANPGGTTKQASATNDNTTVVGSCHGMRGLASVKSDYIDPNDNKPAGLVANIPTPGANHDVRINIKGVAAADGSFGTCTFSGDNTPGAGAHIVSKWTASFVSPATDCIDDNDSAEYPLNGKTTIEFSDGTRTQTYTQATFDSGVDHDFVTQSGVVTKGDGLGALVDDQSYYAPISATDGATDPYPGYAFDRATAAACNNSPVATTGDARDLIVGDGASGLTGHVAAGLTFNVGN